MAELVRDLRDRFDVAPGELDQVEGRLDVIYRLRKNYGDTVSDMLSYLEHCRRELDEMRFSSDTLARLEKKLSSSLKTAREKGKLLSTSRQEEARALEERIQRELRQLDMPKVQFKVDFA
ncbi:DNA repair protein RecN, partial [Intestinimonas massiliensis]|nr:DNA repair protein RecN [Intestinimonas massiliensis (ex Afouda et al. 2020)]